MLCTLIFIVPALVILMLVFQDNPSPCISIGSFERDYPHIVESAKVLNAQNESRWDGINTVVRGTKYPKTILSTDEVKDTAPDLDSHCKAWLGKQV